ncbi:hypothetical protein Hthe01_18680 [Hydrogenophilus thermoluteolus]|uniref:antA/AntB antirepressor family protein n=1 Tax=Hydrogenophilus thermoluteolus TaxID=297 RepID=UPI0024A595EC|nr:antA/AntB antirepressor family protein [Hydrogenophilus thermoluteolus]GLW61519.1 hypothetical protein Hthe01_18680 [Hydrogenophilus thermoluteolus]
MTELVQVREGKIGDANTLVVDARELHAALGVGKDFSTWIKSRIKQYGFVEHQDYVTAKNLRSPISGSSKAREQVAIDYYITLDMAKELAMVERNEKGRRSGSTSSSANAEPIRRPRQAFCWKASQWMERGCGRASRRADLRLRKSRSLRLLATSWRYKGKKACLCCKDRVGRQTY